MTEWEKEKVQKRLEEALARYEDRVPFTTLSGIRRYVLDRCPVGHFLNAVFSNDLFEAVGRADIGNRKAIAAIVELIYNDVPGICHGSPERVKKWLERKEEG